jgi:PHD/YefM family antitoxin component YafN of YafNO toxin-antitoxin module
MKDMKTLTSSEARQGFSTLLSTVKIEPVSILKQGKVVAVMISATRHSELERIEDILYGKAAEIAIKEGVVQHKEAQDLLDRI